MSLLKQIGLFQACGEFSHVLWKTCRWAYFANAKDLGNLLHQFIPSKVSQEAGLRLEWGIVTGISA